MDSIFKIRPSQEILKIRDGTPLESEEILMPSQEILEIRDGPFGGGRNFDIHKKALETNRSFQEILKIHDDRPSQEILKIRDGTPLESEEILKRVAWILFFKIRPSQEILEIRDGPFGGGRNFDIHKKALETNRSFQDILKIHDGTPLESEEILTYIKKPPKQIGMALSSKLYVPNKVVHKKRVAWILFFKIRPSQEILKIRDGTHLEAEEILTYIKKLSKRIEILKIHDGTPLESEEILTYIKSPQNGSVWHFSSKLYVHSNVVQKKRVARILFFKIRPSQEILKIRDGTPLETEEILTHKKVLETDRSFQEILKIHDGTPLESEEILTYIKKPPKQIESSQEIQKNHDGTPLESEEISTYIKKPPKQIVAWILFFKIRSFQEILKIHDGTPLESEEILTYIKKPPKQIGMALSSKLYVPNNVVHKKRVAWILFFKIRPSQEILKIRDEILKIHDGTPLEPSQEILKIRDGTPLESEEILKKRVAWILFFKIRPSQEILEIRDGPFGGGRNFDIHKKALETNRSSQEIQKNHDVAWILFFKIRSFQDILKIHDGTPLESEEILTYIKKPPKQIGMALSSKLYVPNKVVHKKRVAWILFFKIRPSQEILKIRDGTHLEAEEILTYIKKLSKRIEILKIHDGTPLESEEILTYIKSPQNGSVWHFSSKLYVHSNVVQKKRVARILFFKIRPSQEILKIRDGTPLEAEEILTHKKVLETDRSSQEIQKNHDDRVAWILFFKIRSFQEILKIHDGTPLESEEILTYIKKPPKQIGMALSSKLYVPNNVVHKKRVAWILFFKIRPSQEILKIRDGTHLEAEEILTYIKKALETDRSFQEILKIHDGTPLESEEILTYIKSPQNGSVWHFSSKLYVHSNVVQKKRVARILFFKIRPSQEIIKIRDGTPLEAEEVLTHKKSSRNGSVRHFFNKLDDPSNIVQKERVARILFFKIRSFQEILKIHDGTPLESEEILTYIKKPPKQIEPSQEILKIRDGTPLESSQEIQKNHDGTPLESEEISTYIKKPPKQIVAWILFFKIRSFQEILKIHDGTPLESEEILTYIKKPPKQIGMALSSKLYVPNNVVHKKRVAWILFFKIRPSQEILKIRDGTHLEAEEILTYIKKALETNRSFQEILKIHDGTPLESEEILTYIKSPQNGSVWHFSSKLYVHSNVVQKKRVARILFFKIRPSQEILKIRDGTPLEAEEILTHKKVLETDRSSQEIQKNHDDRSFQEILKIHDGTPLESEEILTYIKKPPKQIGMALSSKLYVPNNVVHKKRVAWILFFKIRPSQEILKIRDGTHLEAEEILTYIKKALETDRYGTFLTN
ncbi:hypothetical protein OROMI_005115 [Orobanche minor]